MKKLLIPALAVIVLIAGLAVFNMGSSSDTASTQNNGSESKSILSPSTEKDEEVQATNVVDIEGFAYGPQNITVKKGTTVTWTNKDQAKHDITPIEGAADFVASELLAQGETYEFTFNEVGTYKYKCSPHPYMLGTVVVTE